MYQYLEFSSNSTTLGVNLKSNHIVSRKIDATENCTENDVMDG